MKHRLRSYLPCLLCLMILALLSQGCLRPSENTLYITTTPGQPFQILEEGNKETGKDYYVKGRDLKSGKVILNQKVNGWVSMPPEHWQVIKEKINGVTKYESEKGISIPSVKDTPPAP